MQKQKLPIFPFTYSSIYSFGLFQCEFLSSGDIGFRDVCIFFIRLHYASGAQSANKTHLKNSTEVMTPLLKIVHKRCCEHFHAGTDKRPFTHTHTHSSSYNEIGEK